MSNIECIVNGAHGVYVPMVFAQTVNRAVLSGVSAEVLDYLAREDSVDNEDFWDTWDSVMNNARIAVDGKIYHLHHDGDLFIVDWDNLTEEEKESLGFSQ